MMGQINRTIRSKFVYIIYVLSVIAIIVLLFESWLIGSIFLLLFIILFIYDVREERKIRKKRIEDMLQLSLQVEKAGKEVFLNLPIGIILYNDAYEIEWINPYLRRFFPDEEDWRKRS